MTHSRLMQVAMVQQNERQDLICPMTQHYFCWPVVLSPCGHVVEKAEGDSCYQHDATCPVCQRSIQMICRAPSQIYEQLDYFLRVQPQLHDRRGFYPFYMDILCKIPELKRDIIFLEETGKNIEEELRKRGVNFLYEALDIHNQLDQELFLKKREQWQLLAEKQACCEEFEFQLKKLIELFIASPAQFNVISDQPCQGTSAVYYFSSTALGQKILTDHPTLFENISATALNTVCAKDGLTPIFCLVFSVEGMMLLNRMVEKIGQEGLNQVPTHGYYSGTSAVYHLSQSVEGIALLDKVKDKITESSLNALSTIEKDRGLSAVWHLAFHGEPGIKLLFELRYLISSQGLNAICQTGEYQGLSVCSLLTLHPIGVQLLYLFHRTITPQALNSIMIKTGEFAAYYLLSTPEGRSLLLYDEAYLCRMMDESLFSTSVLCRNGERCPLVDLFIGPLDETAEQILFLQPKLHRAVEERKNEFSFGTKRIERLTRSPIQSSQAFFSNSAQPRLPSPPASQPMPLRRKRSREIGMAGDVQSSAVDSPCVLL